VRATVVKLNLQPQIYSTNLHSRFDPIECIFRSDGEMQGAEPQPSGLHSRCSDPSKGSGSVNATGAKMICCIALDPQPAQFIFLNMLDHLL
jgi:hypothetical protein